MNLPWRRAPLAALGSPVTVLVAVVTGLEVAFVAASTVFHVSAAGSTAVQYVIGKRCQDETGVSVERGGRGGFARSQRDGLPASLVPLVLLVAAVTAVAVALAAAVATRAVLRAPVRELVRGTG